MQIATVVIEGANASYDKKYDYILPTEIKAEKGCRVLVPFGAGNRSRIALVLNVWQGEANAKTKAVLLALDQSPILTHEGLLLLEVVKQTTFCRWFEALRVLVPPGAGMQAQGVVTAVANAVLPQGISAQGQKLFEFLKSKRSGATLEEIAEKMGAQVNAKVVDEILSAGCAVRENRIKKRVADERAIMVRLLDLDKATKATPKQQGVIDLLGQIGCASVKEICYFTGVGRAVVDTLRKNGVVEFFEEVTPRKTKDKIIEATDLSEIKLSAEQQQAFENINSLREQGSYNVSLLHGVTGSGKTQIFLKLIEKTILENKKALVLIPEISLTPQTVSKFLERFGGRVAVLHSSLSMTERLDEWERIRAKKADIVVGTRSAVFAPLENIGLIVIDEEQEHTYHSESAPRYHARDIAKLRAKNNNAQLLLCSATPSVESYYNAKNGSYNLFELAQRYSGNQLPQVMKIDMRTAVLSVYSTTMSQELCEQLNENLSRKEQAILLLNRRGYNTMVKCSACGEVAKCPHCSIPLTYHAANRRLICHYCGYSQGENNPCQSCKSQMLRFTGVGTQRIEEELKAIFPHARVLRMDMDTTMSRFAHEKAFTAFANGEYDIMVGTQMVAKGLNFPNVTLVGVLAADQSLYGEDFRSFERTFSLITQVVGRCGRAEKPGRAVIQTFTPDNRILTLAAQQDYQEFYKEEIAYRRVGLYPPYCSMVCIAFWDEDEKKVATTAKGYARELVRQLKENYSQLPVRILGPTECRPYKVAGRFRVRILVKCRGDKQTRELFLAMQQWSSAQKEQSLTTIDFYYDSNM